jgi:heme/copper-type cytochrome/quinol oxidase subunit 3
MFGCAFFLAVFTMLETSPKKLLIWGVVHSLLGLAFMYFAYQHVSEGKNGLALMSAGVAIGQLLTPFSRAPVLKFSTPVTQAADHAIVHPESWALRAGFLLSVLMCIGGFIAHLYGVFG